MSPDEAARGRVERRLAELGLELPPMSEAVGNYEKAVLSGNLLFLSGQGPRKPGAYQYRGKVGLDYTLEEGYEAARFTALALLATVKAVLGDLDRVRRVVKVLGFVNCTEDFTDQPKVLNGASDLLVQVFGDKGRHARSAIGAQQLPGGIPVEIEMVLEVEG
ncbi:MAG: RidA family protein [Bacillota bacterium]